MSSVVALAFAVLSGCTEPMAPVLSVEEHQDLAALVDGEFAPDRVMVGVAPGFHEMGKFRGQELRAAKEWHDLGVMALEVPEGEDALEVVAELRADPSWSFVEPDLVRYASGTANDPYLSYQWNLTTIDAFTAWDTADGSGAIVAVVDTGVSTAGDDTPAFAALGYDFVDNDADPSDLNGHGTHVAGTIAQATNNGAGVAGVAPGAQILPVRALDASGSGYMSDIVDAVMYAADQGADVINMSYGSSWSSTSETTALSYAAGKGCVLVAASGNSSKSTGVDYPARYSDVISVGATRYDNTRASYSNYGTDSELMAPGGDTSVDQNGDGYSDGILQETFSGSSWSYYFWQGTSMAAPHVAGVAALLVELGATRDEVRTTLQETAVDLGNAGYDTTYGYGLVDAAAAVEAFAAAPAEPADTTAPTVSAISYSYKKTSKTLKVTFTTSEVATGKVCDDKSVCTTTAAGTSHSASFKVSGTKFTVTATDAAGNAGSVGPYTFR